MPIRLNLLAEAQAAEELRRKDPVKRAIWVATLLVTIMLVWSSSLQVKAMMANREVAKAEGLTSGYTNDFDQVVANQKKEAELQRKLIALQEMSTNRLLQATILNALQKSTVDDVQLLHFRVDQNFALTPEVKGKTKPDGRVIPSKPASITEHIALTLDGSDDSPNPGDQVTKLKAALLQNPYFHDVLGNTNAFVLKNLSTPEFSPASGKRAVNFTLECRYPERTR
ncbi:MAG TPA: hypothetical protein VHH88_04045 [Verrucomicrobiae bacterium]|nr:hypothetical protein [Verrucomicrobiae bacterium]